MMLSEPRTCLLGIAAIAVLAFVLVSCDSDSPAEAPSASITPTTTPAPSVDLSNVRIMLERTLCLDVCPQYELTILGDGTVHYVAGHNVLTTGLRTTSIAEEDVRLLLDRFEQIGFLDLDDNYSCRALFDGSWTITTLAIGDDKKSIQRCAFVDETRSLFGLEELIDEITNSRQWVGLPDKVIEMSRGFYPAPDAEFCAWPCTDYTLTIYQDGRVEYDGFKNVDVIGTRNDEISEADVLDLVDRFLESGFFDLPPDFHCQVTDVSATTTAVFLRTRENRIERCHTSLPGGPLEPVRQLELMIAELTGLERWTGEGPTND
ncbi:MAG: hypothetical protein J4N95_02260 [Chloroflexi bacterium]|nr:hypothetical protein [Chloroflexota bacterium]